MRSNMRSISMYKKKLQERGRRCPPHFILYRFDSVTARGCYVRIFASSFEDTASRAILMHTSTHIGGFSPDLYFSLSLVILAATIYPCIVALTAFCANHHGGTGAGHKQGEPRLIVTDFQLRCAYAISLLLAIGLVILSGLLVSQLDQKHIHPVLLALLVSIPRAHTFYEVLHIEIFSYANANAVQSRFLRLTVDLYRHAVWIGWGYGGAVLAVLLMCVSFLPLWN